MSGGSSEGYDDDFSLLILASDLGVDARSFITDPPSDEVWYDCFTSIPHPEVGDFSDLRALQAFRVEGADRNGNRILRIVGRFFPANVITGERLKKYVSHKLLSELAEGPYCIVYMHSTVKKEDNFPGLPVLRWIYEDLPSNFKERLHAVYFLHPGIHSRLVIAMLGRFLSGSLYWKIKYVSRLQYLWDVIQKGQVEIPEFVKKHDDVLERRPLTDYGVEPDPLHLTNPFRLAEPPSTEYSFGRHGDRLSSRTYTWC